MYQKLEQEKQCVMCKGANGVRIVKADGYSQCQ